MKILAYVLALLALTMLLAAISRAIDIPGPPPIPILPTSLRVSWYYDPAQLAATHTLTDLTTGQIAIVTNAPITFFVWRTFDLTNWVCVTNVVNQTNAVIPFVNQWADYAVSASNSCCTSVFSNVANFPAMPVRPKMDSLQLSK